MAGADAVTANARCAALYDLVVNGGAGDGTRPSTRMGIGYIVDAQTLFHQPHEGSVAQTWAGEDIDPTRVSHLACDAEWYGIAINNLDQPDQVGRTRRKASREQRLQLRALYSSCPLDGTPFDRCHIHHVNVYWEDNGQTEIDNLLPISTTWHHRIHHKGWTLKMGANRSLKLWRPDGTLEREIPPPTPITRE